MAAKAQVGPRGTRVICPGCNLDLWLPKGKEAMILASSGGIKKVKMETLAAAMLPIGREKNELRVRGHQFFVFPEDEGTTVRDKNKKVVLKTILKPTPKAMRRRLRDLVDSGKYPGVKASSQK